MSVELIFSFTVSNLNTVYQIDWKCITLFFSLQSILMTSIFVNYFVLLPAWRPLYLSDKLQVWVVNDEWKWWNMFLFTLYHDCSNRIKSTPNYSNRLIIYHDSHAFLSPQFLSIHFCYTLHTFSVHQSLTSCPPFFCRVVKLVVSR